MILVGKLFFGEVVGIVVDWIVLRELLVRVIPGVAEVGLDHVIDLRA